MNLPETLLKQLINLPGFDQEAFVRSHKAPAPTSIRLHPAKGASVHTEALKPVPWCKHAFYLPERPLFTTDPLLHAGAYYVQEASSMFLDNLLKVALPPEEKGRRILDLCAAPGGKSTLIASRLGNNDLLISNEVIRSRASILEENISKWGMNNTWVCSNDPRELGQLNGYFDLVLVDAPCSGSGLFRKDPGAINEWSENNVQLCSERQKRILADIWPTLKHEGCLIYSTCSYSVAENEDILDFLAENMDIESIEVATEEIWGIQPTRSARHNMQGYRFSPDKVEGEGFFVALLRKREVSSAYPLPRFKNPQNKKVLEAAQKLLEGSGFSILENERKQFTAIQKQHEADREYLKQHLYIRKCGVLLGIPGAKEWIPEHDIALSLDAHKDLPYLELNKEQALLFLKKENFDIGNSIAKGWHIVTYTGLGLGWIKVLPNRINNYLPKHWRIRMDIDFDQL